MSDLIERAEAIKAVNKFLDRETLLYRFVRKTAIDAIIQVPSADRPQEWIPCSERLPNIGEKVLASTKKTVFTQVFKGYHSDPKRWAWENNRVKEIEAWQPLPKPWKGADDE